MNTKPKQLARAISLLKAGRLTDKQIAAKVGLSYNCARTHRCKLGLPARGRIGAPRVYGDDVVREVKMYRNSWLTFRAIGNLIGCTERTAVRLFNER